MDSFGNVYEWVGLRADMQSEKAIRAYLKALAGSVMNEALASMVREGLIGGETALRLGMEILVMIGEEADVEHGGPGEAELAEPEKVEHGALPEGKKETSEVESTPVEEEVKPKKRRRQGEPPPLEKHCPVCGVPLSGKGAVGCRKHWRQVKAEMTGE